ncbi:hypothetical protein LCGC14_0488610 [marine sediment metagenome]|uniref:Uncharacterized protein n=1 Tax=marine sediment metagenome TaxID=412755 RepID=A0A0F9SCH8_9ZZZZ
MDTNSSSQMLNASEGQTGCERCIKLESINRDLYEALEGVARDLEGGRGVIFPYTENKVRQALAKAKEA